MARVLTYDALPPDVQANLDLAYRAFGRRRYDEAIRGFTAVVDAYPAYIHGVFTLVRALRASDDRALATPVIDRRDPASGTGLSRYLTLHGLVHHTAYHAGQIALLKRAIEARVS